MKKIIITDSSLRDGNHSVSHSIELSSIKKYCQAADDAGIPIVEIGHGNGLGASSLLIGKASFSDHDMLKTARENLSNSKLGVHVIPGIATIEKDIKPAIDLGVDVFRIASHCSEATVTKSHIEFLRKKNIEVFGVLMMTALASPEELVQNALEMEAYGALGIIIMDSTGTYLPSDVEKRIKLLVDKLEIPVGFHAHNNLSYAIHNSVVAIQNGATYIDACIRGFGAGAGNAPLEILIPVLDKYGYTVDVNFKNRKRENNDVFNNSQYDSIC